MPIDAIPFDIAEHLTHPADQAELIEDAFASGDPSIVRNALNLVARAQGMTQVAREAGVTREALYRSLSAEGDPRMSTLFGVVKALGVKLRATIEPASRDDAEVSDLP